MPELLEQEQEAPVSTFEEQLSQIMLAADNPVAPADPVVFEAPPPAMQEEQVQADPPEKGEPQKVRSFRALKDQKDKEREDALEAQRKDYDTRLAEVTGKATTHETTARTLQERLEAAEALKAAHEAKANDLERKIVGDYETPYSLQVDPEALPVQAAIRKSTQSLDAAVAQAASGLHDDPAAVHAINASKGLFANLMLAMTQGLSPDAVHANTLVEGLAKLNINVANEDARATIRQLKASLPHFATLVESQGTLKEIAERNRPNWERDQAARHEAYRRELIAGADVPDDATEGDDALLAGLLKAQPDLRAVLKAEMEKLSGVALGPVPGKATAAAVRAAPRQLHETAVRAARVPVLAQAVRQYQANEATLNARIADLEARIANQSGAVPKPGGNPLPGASGSKVDFSEALSRLFE